MQSSTCSKQDRAGQIRALSAALESLFLSGHRASFYVEKIAPVDDGRQEHERIYTQHSMIGFEAISHYTHE